MPSRPLANSQRSTRLGRLLKLSKMLTCVALPNRQYPRIPIDAYSTTHTVQIQPRSFGATAMQTAGTRRGAHRSGKGNRRTRAHTNTRSGDRGAGPVHACGREIDDQRLPLLGGPVQLRAHVEDIRVVREGKPDRWKHEEEFVADLMRRTLSKTAPHPFASGECGGAAHAHAYVCKSHRGLLVVGSGSQRVLDYQQRSADCRTHKAPRDGAEVPKWAERAEPAHAVQREA